MATLVQMAPSLCPPVLPLLQRGRAGAVQLTQQQVRAEQGRRREGYG
jgi:hypothetical protein